MDLLGSTVWEKRKASVKKSLGRTQESDFAGLQVATREWFSICVMERDSVGQTEELSFLIIQIH